MYSGRPEAREVSLQGKPIDAVKVGVSTSEGRDVRASIERDFNHVHQGVAVSGMPASPGPAVLARQLVRGLRREDWWHRGICCFTTWLFALEGSKARYFDPIVLLDPR